MMPSSLFIIDFMGLFLYQNRLHNIYMGFTHYKYYRAFLLEWQFPGEST